MKKIFLCLFVCVLLSAPFALRADAADLSSAIHLYYSRDYQAAVEAFKQIVVDAPENVAAYYYLGYTYQEMGNYPAAREAFQKTYEINPDFVPDVVGAGE
jgi:tetratricopeptide (TPR) repeat protein